MTFIPEEQYVDLDSAHNHMLDCGHDAGKFTSFSQAAPFDASEDHQFAFVKCTICGQTELRPC
jgi:hypothetical protein